jgi:tripartite-type tricarboxylate transporter receptor subunit TctC
MSLTAILRSASWKRSAVALLGALALLLAAAPGRGAGYPDRPIRIIVPFEPGGGGDIIVRLVGQELSQRLAVPVVVENRTGASGNIGTDVVAHAAADGYTLLMANVAPMAINAALYRQLPYDPAKDFTAIAPLAVFANILVVPPSLGVRDVQALVALSKNRPAGLNYASAGAGSITNLAAVMFGLATGANLVQVPFRGGGPAIAALSAPTSISTFPAFRRRCLTYRVASSSRSGSPARSVPSPPRRSRRWRNPVCQASTP